MHFANPLFLIGLVAVAIPIAVHLFNFRRYKKVYFSNVSALEALRKESRRVSQLRSLLILALRILAIVFLVLAFAQPYVSRNGDAVSQGERAVSVYVDNSYSMMQEGKEGSLLEMAKRKAEEIALAYGPSDRFQLITNDMTGAQFHWLTREEYLEAVGGIEASPSAVKISAVEERQRQFVKQSGANEKHCYVVSDFQRSVADALKGETRDGVRNFYIPMVASAINNLYVDTLEFSTPTFYKGREVRGSVRLRNAGENSLEQVGVSVYCGGRKRFVGAVDLPAGGSADVEFHFTAEEVGVMDGWVETTDYPILFDDTLYFTLNVREKMRVMTVCEGKDDEYLRRLFGFDEAVEYEVKNPTDAAASLSSVEEDDDYCLVVVDELKSVSTHLSQRLQDYIARGGRIMVIAAKEADVNSYNQLLGPIRGPLLGDYSSKEERVSVLDVENALYSQVFSGVTDDVELPSFKGHYRVRSSAKEVSQAVMRLVSGDAVLMSFYPESGNVSYVMLSPMQDGQSDFVNQSLYVPTLYNMALYGGENVRSNYTLGGSDAVIVPKRVVGQALSSSDGSFRCEPHLERHKDRYNFLPMGQVQSAGNYRIGDYGIALNYSRTESEMSFLTESELKEKCGREAILTQSGVVNPNRLDGKRYGTLCLVLALVMLLAEEWVIRFYQPKMKEAGKNA